MKANFNTPEYEIVYLNEYDVIAASTESGGGTGGGSSSGGGIEDILDDIFNK